MPDFETDGIEHLAAGPDKRAGAKRSPIRRLDVVILVVTHLQLLWFVFVGELHYIDLLIIFAAEVVVVNQLSSVLYPANGRQLGSKSIGRLIGMIVFIGLLIGEYAILLNGSAHPTSLLAHFNVHDLFVGIVYTAIRVIGAFLAAKSSADPKLSWARTSMMVQGIAFITLLIMLTFGFLAAFFIVSALQQARPDISPGAVLSTMIIAIHFFYGSWASTFSNEEILRIAGNST